MNTKLKCLILDDELPGLTYLKLLCEQIPGVEVVKAFHSPAVFLQEKERLDYDFCILDIQMSEMDGLSLANLLKGVPVIFTTAYSEYAVEAFELDAVDYVRKPIRKERLEKAVDKVRERLSTRSPQQKFVQLNTDKGKTLLFFGKLCYIAAMESDSRDKTALLEDSPSVTLKNITFDQLQGLLPKDQFCRINKREIIAMRCVRHFTHDLVETNIPGEQGKFKTLTLGDAYRSNFLRLIGKR